ncbi:amidohydrolase [Mesorhizobium sp.]|uniref:amidohydrolase n=1 Tax=Mesorhizobium sp. TaxID=1871066 RepID=UPI0025F92F70|nr:amidohydrolase [Mesorhizobium sp.]
MIAEHLKQQMVAWRRHLHANPELATFEVSTSDFVAARLSELGIPFQRNVGGHGIVASLTRAGSSRSIGLRADMDALPIQEQTGLEHASVIDGVMHACGHDGHTASLLGAASLLAGDTDWSGTVRLIFQPAEERGIGAKAMIEEGFFENFPVDMLFAYHNWPGLPAGKIAAVAGPVMAAGARIAIRITGKAAHAAMPHQSRDALAAAGYLLTTLQSIAGRAVDPLQAAVVSITTLETGAVLNQVPEAVKLGGLMRTLNVATRDRVEAEIERICNGIAMAMGVTIDLTIQRTVLPTVNAPYAAEIAARAAEAIGAPVTKELEPSLASEDFSYFLSRKPGALVWIGNGEDLAGRELHSPGYDFNDEILPVAASWLAEVAKQALRANPDLS